MESRLAPDPRRVRRVGDDRVRAGHAYVLTGRRRGHGRPAGRRSHLGVPAWVLVTTSSAPVGCDAIPADDLTTANTSAQKSLPYRVFVLDADNGNDPVLYEQAREPDGRTALTSSAWSDCDSFADGASRVDGIPRPSCPRPSALPGRSRCWWPGRSAPTTRIPVGVVLR